MILFILELSAKAATALAERRQREKWAGCTIEPPTTKWPADKGYACFLSHYKMEAASDARLLHDMLAKMLRYPVFLDSAKLTDLRQLISNGVADSDVLLVLATKGYITRPWCLLEVVHAARRSVPILLVDIKNGGFDAAETQAYVDQIEEAMGVCPPDSNPSQTIRRSVHQPLSRSGPASRHRARTLTGWRCFTSTLAATSPSSRTRAPACSRRSPAVPTGPANCSTK